MAVAAGDVHSVALKNDGTIVEWGYNASGQATAPSFLPTSEVYGTPPNLAIIREAPLVPEMIAAAGDHTTAALYSRLLSYPVNAAKDVLLIFNATNASCSSNVCAYYVQHRPGMSAANLLGISMETNEVQSYAVYSNSFVWAVNTWLSNNPTLRPRYVILFPDFPDLINFPTYSLGTQYDIALSNGSDSLGEALDFPGSWMPLVTSISMNGISGSNDCLAYIDKIARVASNNPPGSVIISGRKAALPNTQWFFDGGCCFQGMRYCLDLECPTLFPLLRFS